MLNNSKKNIASRLKDAIIFYYESLNLKTNNTNKENNEYFIINKNYIIKIESILQKDKISEVLKNDNKINFNNKKEIQNLIDKVKTSIDSNKFFESIEEKNIEKELNNDENFCQLPIKEYYKNNGHKLIYYNDCKVINSKMLDIIKKLDKKLYDKDNYHKCYLDNNYVYINLNDEIINIGSIDKNNMFYTQYIIYSNKSEIPKIIEYFNSKGIKNLDGLSNNNIITIPLYWFSSVQAGIYEIIQENNIDFYKFSNKLKVLICLSILQYNKFKKNEKKYLINLDWLEQYEYKKINSFIKENNEVQNYLKNNNNLNFNKIFDSIDNIITDKKFLMDIDKNIINKTNTISFNANFENLDLIDKKIKIYKNFILINQEILNKFNNYFISSISSSNWNNLNYYFSQNKDILEIDENPQFTHLVGNLDTESNTFIIDYILEFNSSTIFYNEKKEVIKGIENYIKCRTVFNEKKTNDYVSPIFSKNEILGYCYRYLTNIDYNSSKKYLNYESNEILLNVINLYFNYQRINEKMKRKSKNIEKEKYYLINKDLIEEIKKEYNYKEIVLLMKKYNIINNDYKNRLILIKNLTDLELNKYFGKKALKEKFSNEKNKISLKTLYNKTDICNIIMIYDNFEIIEKDIIKLFIDDINKLNDCYLECTINEEKIIVHYPDNFVENQYASVIGKLDEDNSFITEYILVYKNQNEKYNHLNKIKGQLNNYLNNLQLFNNTEPILKDNVNFEIIGTIIKYDENINNNAINNDINIMNDNNNINNDPIIINNSIIDDNYINNQNNKESLNNNDEYRLIKQNINIRNNPNLNIRNVFNQNIPLIGLQNIGATCYMNATLQCFCHIEKLINFFKYDNQANTLFSILSFTTLLL